MVPMTVLVQSSVVTYQRQPLAHGQPRKPEVRLPGQQGQAYHRSRHRAQLLQSDLPGAHHIILGKGTRAKKGTCSNSQGSMWCLINEVECKHRLKKGREKT